MKKRKVGQPLTAKELKALRKFIKDMTVDDDEAIEIAKKAGILTKKGKLAKRYQPEPSPEELPALTLRGDRVGPEDRFKGSRGDTY